MQRKRKDLNTISTGKKKNSSEWPALNHIWELHPWGVVQIRGRSVRRAKENGRWREKKMKQLWRLAVQVFGRKRKRERKKALEQMLKWEVRGGRKKSPQESQNERITEFLPDNFFKRFPQGRATAWIKLLKAWWENILAAQFCFPVKSNISRPHKIMVSVLWKIAIFLTIVSRMFYFSLPYTQWQEWQALFIKAGPFET